MECSVTAQSISSTCLSPANSKEQFTGVGVIGYSLFGRVVPVVFDIILSSERTKKVIVQADGERLHRCFFYEMEKMSACCRTVLKFNISHYIKCYLPGTLGKNDKITTPYTFNYCERCDIGVTDDCGNTLGMTQYREWFNGKRIWKACDRVQNCGGCDNLGYPLQTNNEIEYNLDGAAVNVATSGPICTSCNIKKKPIVKSGCKKCGG